MAVGYLLMALAIPGSLYFGSVVVGACYGVRTTDSCTTSSYLIFLLVHSFFLVFLRVCSTMLKIHRLLMEATRAWEHIVTV
ncbi:unnamed protein product [Brassica oleracea var. botrytis]